MQERLEVRDQVVLFARYYLLLLYLLVYNAHAIYMYMQKAN